MSSLKAFPEELQGPRRAFPKSPGVMPVETCLLFAPHNHSWGIEGTRGVMLLPDNLPCNERIDLSGRVEFISGTLALAEHIKGKRKAKYQPFQFPFASVPVTEIHHGIRPVQSKCTVHHQVPNSLVIVWIPQEHVPKETQGEPNFSSFQEIQPPALVSLPCAMSARSIHANTPGMQCAGAL